MSELYHLIDGKRVAGKSGRFGPVYNPTTGEEAARVPLASADETRQAIASAARAFPGWAAQSPQNRARVMFKFKQLLEDNMDTLATLIANEHGKVVSDAEVLMVSEGDVVLIPAGENHWHGAPDATSMAHITITVNGSQTEQTEA